MGLIKSKLKRRFRKKFHVGEFQEFGFEVGIIFRKELTEMEFDRFYDDFINLIDKNNLLFGGGGCSKEVEGFISSAKKRASITSEEREKIKNWLKMREGVANSNIGKLKDCWIG